MTHAPYPPGPYTLIGDTISAGPQPQIDGQGRPIPGAITQPSLADLRPMPDPAQRAAVAELFRAAPEVLAQRDDLARRLGQAIDYIEHGIGHEAGVDSVQALRRLLDREIVKERPLLAGFGQGANRSEAQFDLHGAKVAVALARRDPQAGQMASYAQLQQLVEKLAGALDRVIDEYVDSRDAVGSREEHLVKEAYGLLNQSYEPRPAAGPRP